MAKTLNGCAYCERDVDDVRLCCAAHARLVCSSCREKSVSYAHDHAAAA